MLTRMDYLFPSEAALQQPHQAKALADMCSLCDETQLQHLAVFARQQQQAQQELLPDGAVSPFRMAAAQDMLDLAKPLARSSWPGLLNPQQQQHDDAQHQLLMSSSWREDSMRSSSSRMMSFSMCSSGSSSQLHQQMQEHLSCQQENMSCQHQQDHLQHYKQLQDFQQQQLQQTSPQQQQQQLQLQLRSAAAGRTASCSLTSPCCSTFSDFGDLSCSSLDSSCAGAASVSGAHSNASSSLPWAPPGSHSSSTSSSTSSASMPGCTATVVDAAAHLLCRTASDASSTWSSKSHHIASRAAPGGALGTGIGWVMPEFRGREVLSDFEFGKVLGCGTFGVTRLVTHRRTARPWACKTICKATIAASPAAQSDVQNEVAILQHLKGHSGVVQVKGVYEDERNIHLVMELCTGGDLLDYISRFGRLSEAESADVAAVMLSTLGHCHRLGVMHRDIKPENFLLGAPTLLSAPAGSAASVLKIGDFGVSAFYQQAEHFTEIVGTPFYMAPEVLERCYSHEADIWSVGVVTFLMLAGRLPFDGLNDREIIKAVLDSEPDFASPAWEGISPQAQDCVARMLVKDPKRRASVEQLLQHPWLAGRPQGSNPHRISTGGGSSCQAAAVAGQQQPLCPGCQQGSCCRCPSLNSSSFQQQPQPADKAGGVSWASPCVTAIAGSAQTPRHERSHSPTPRKPNLAPLKPSKSRLAL